VRFGVVREVGIDEAAGDGLAVESRDEEDELAQAGEVVPKVLDPRRRPMGSAFVRTSIIASRSASVSAGAIASPEGAAGCT
jgi:hypothetical protein